MNIGESIVIWIETSFKKRNATLKRKIRRARRIARRGSNWKALNKGKGRTGFKRIKMKGKTYIFKRMSGTEKVTKKRIGHKLGLASWLRSSQKGKKKFRPEKNI